MPHPDNERCLRLLGTDPTGHAIFCAEPVSVIGAHYCEACGGPSAIQPLSYLKSSDPREVRCDPINSAESPTIKNPPAGLLHLSRKLFVDAMEAGITETIFLIAGRESRIVADLLERLGISLCARSEEERQNIRKEK
jgi:hypothetical protein